MICMYACMSGAMLVLLQIEDDSRRYSIVYTLYSLAVVARDMPLAITQFLICPYSSQDLTFLYGSQEVDDFHRILYMFLLPFMAKYQMNV